MSSFRPRLFLRKLMRLPTVPVIEQQSPKTCLRLNLAGKVALVTGATGQVGRAISRTLGACGADVAIHYHNSRDRAESLAEEIARLGVRSCAAQADITDRQSVAGLKAAVASTLGRVDIVVINAIAWYTRAAVLDLAADEFDNVYRTSVLQSANLVQAFVPAMIPQRWGRVIAISSEVASQSLPNTAPYCAAKRGMDGLLRVLAREIGPHQITVNSIAPGWIVTDRDRNEATESQPDYEREVPMLRRGFDQDVANAVAFLASDLASFISGTYLPICGGNVMPDI